MRGRGFIEALTQVHRMRYARSLRTFAFVWLLPTALLLACYPEREPRQQDNLEPSTGGAPPASTSSDGSGTGGATGRGSGGGMGRATGGGGGGATDDSGMGGATGNGSGMGGATGADGPDTGGSGAETLSGLAIGGIGGSTDAGGSTDTGGSGGTESRSGTCDEVFGEPLPARLEITSEDAPIVDPVQVITVTRQSLWNDFVNQTCGTAPCHGGADEPLLASPKTFKMTIASFDQRPTLGDDAVARVTSSDPNLVMPPGSGDGSLRDETHPALRLALRLQKWQNAGFPEAFDEVIGSEQPSGDLPENPYLLSPELGETLTNLGSCVPNASLSVNSPLMLTEQMEALDAMFAAAEDSDALPDTLVETDLVSLDSYVLASRGVYSYAPTYTLFSDHAGKMRHVRVPVGQTIRYNPDTKDFDIPDNTRFYKTFLKQVKDADGNIGWRKMETRLIVVRRDEGVPDGGFRPRALRTSYAWDKGETMALRVKDPLRNGEPFADRLCPYVVDESVERDPLLNPISDDMSEYCSYMTGEELGDPTSGQVRHYAIPSAERCDQCHMGSSSHSYILGFNPWQVDRRPEGEGGIYENPTADELTQLARLIEYGVVSGIEPGEAKLEESQGDRLPRNDYELTAQGYMLGNCAFCHNPHGFPVVQNPLLAPFNMFPSEDGGGIFQFSLERYSPRAKAGKDQKIRFPYITPAFGDHWADKQDLTRRNDKEMPWGHLESPPTEDFYDDPPPPDVYDALDELGNVKERLLRFLGPWRSLIWRNVYTPFTYNEDFTIFIHMPRNAPGYDPRAHKIMAEWMLSIPSTPKPGDGEHQPVVEVLPGEAGYDEAVQQALGRIDDFNFGITGSHLPTDDDIVDPSVVLSPVDPGGAGKRQPSPIDDGILNSERVFPENLVLAPLYDAVPNHAHWVPTDTTDPPGIWVPRRSNWEQLIATREVAFDDPKLERMVDQLQGVHLSAEQQAFSLEPMPMGLWDPDCQASSEAAASPTVEELLAEPGAPFRRWLDGNFHDEKPPAEVAPEARVHFQSRGEAVFRAICMNCHGKEADSRSPLAATILELSGGQTRVANFVDGLFGPRLAPGAFARDEFLVNQGATPAEWQLRYMLFMGLGGTLAEIPPDVLNLVAVSPFYGEPTNPGSSDPNMLDSAMQLCAQVLKHPRLFVEDSPRPNLKSSEVFAAGTGHYDLWESLCTQGNEPVVIAFNFFGEDFHANHGDVYRAKDDADHWIYPPDHRVGNPLGGFEVGIQPGNTLPWCVELRSTTPEKLTDEQEKIAKHFEKFGVDPSQIPLCPEVLFATALGKRIHNVVFDNPAAPLGNQEFIERWTRHGAMNAGMAAYYYLNGLTRGELQPSQPFDACGQN